MYEWLDEAKGDVRPPDRTTATHIFDGIIHYAHTGGGNIKPLQGDMTGAYRLRLGDYRIVFSLPDDIVLIFGVRNGRKTYH